MKSAHLVCALTSPIPCAVCGKEIVTIDDAEAEWTEVGGSWPTPPAIIHAACRTSGKHGTRLRTAAAVVKVASMAGWVDGWNAGWRAFAARLSAPEPQEVASWH